MTTPSGCFAYGTVRPPLALTGKDPFCSTVCCKKTYRVRNAAEGAWLERAHRQPAERDVQDGEVAAS